MSHTSTCERTGHQDPAPVDVLVACSAPVVAGGEPAVARARSFVVLPEVRWAAVVARRVRPRARGAWCSAVPGVVVAVLFAACYAAGGWEPALAGLAALRQRSLDVDLLMIVAAVLAAAIGQVFDGALLIVIFATSGALEAVATKRTADNVRALLDLAPEQSTRLSASGAEQRVASADLAVGDIAARPPGRADRCRRRRHRRRQRRRSGLDHGRAAAGGQAARQRGLRRDGQRHRGAPGPRRAAGAASRWWRGSSRWSSRRRRRRRAPQLFIERVEQRYSVGIVDRDPGARRRPARARRRRSSRPCCER